MPWRLFRHDYPHMLNCEPKSPSNEQFAPVNWLVEGKSAGKLVIYSISYLNIRIALVHRFTMIYPLVI